MINKYLTLIIFFVAQINLTYAQEIPSPNAINEKVIYFLGTKGTDTPDRRKLKDSVDFYAFAIEIKVIRKGNNTHVKSIQANDSIAYVLYKDFDFLKSINFRSLLRRQKQATIIIPVGVVIAFVNHPVSPVPLLKAVTLPSKLTKMFNYDGKNKTENISRFIYLNPVVILAGTIVYD